MANTLIIRRRIKSVKNTRQITKAMELVAATKMRRAQQQAIRSRTYAEVAWSMINHLAGKVEAREHPLLKRPLEIKSAAIILLSSNRGLAGTFNNQIIATALKHIERLRAQYAGIKIDVLTIGRKGAEAMVKNQLRVAADFKRVDINVQVADILPLSALIIKKFIASEYDQAWLVYTDFVSSLVQKPQIKQLLPFPSLKELWEISRTDNLGRVEVEAPTAQLDFFDQNFEYKFEPRPSRVLEILLPRLLELQLYQALLQSNASEHSARMMAMKTATDAAADIISDLTLEYNQMRQASITKEICEISAGRLAVT